MSSAPERVKFTDLTVVLRPSVKVQKSDYLPDGLLPVVDQGAGLIGGFTNDMSARFPSPEPVIVFGDHTCRFKYVPFPFAAGADGTQVFRGRDGIDTRYLYYACLTLGLEHFGYQRHMKHLKVAEVPVWPVHTQQRIAAILSAYDDLIENNTRRIAILEEMARRLYDEWFVRFCFPGYEEAEFDGGTPREWDIGVLKDVVVLQRGFDLPTNARTPGPYPVFAATGKHGMHEEAKVKGPGVVTGRSGSLGTVVYVDEDFWPLNTTLWGKEFPLGSPLYAFYVLSAMDLAGFNSGAAVPTLNRNDIHDLPMALPPQELLRSFEQAVKPICQQGRLLHRKNANLRAQRDLLLPKLVSGEIDVSGAEAALEAAE